MKGRTSDDSKCFNPRPRTEGDIIKDYMSAKLFVSIHALARRATADSAGFGARRQVSIHALARRATEVEPKLLTDLG